MEYRTVHTKPPFLHTPGPKVFHQHVAVRQELLDELPCQSIGVVQMQMHINSTGRQAPRCRQGVQYMYNTAVAHLPRDVQYRQARRAVMVACVYVSTVACAPSVFFPQIDTDRQLVPSKAAPPVARTFGVTLSAFNSKGGWWLVVGVDSKGLVAP